MFKALKLGDYHGTLLLKIKNDLCPFAYRKFLIQYAQKDFYTFSEVVNDEGNVTGWNVRRNRLVVDSTELNEETGDVDKDFAVDTDNSYTVWFVDIQGNCPCQYRKCSGIACRHVLNVTASKVVDTNSGITGVIGGAAIDYWLNSNINPTPTVEAMAVDNRAYSMSSITLLTSPNLSKEESKTSLRTAANKLIDFVIDNNIHGREELENQFKSIFNNYVQKYGTKKSKLGIDVSAVASSSSLSAIGNPTSQPKQAGRHKGQFEFATGVVKPAQIKTGAPKISSNKRKRDTTGKPNTESSSISIASSSRGPAVVIELTADGAEKEQLNDE